MLLKKLGFLVPVSIVILAIYLASNYKEEKKQEPPVISAPKILFKSDVDGSNGMVSSASKYATRVGIEILKNGGNAVDAAVAIGFALAVTYPQAGNIGGGGFMVIRTKDTITSIDYREKAPSGSARNMFLDQKGNFIPEKSQLGYLSCGVPGSVAGLLYALDKYGTMSRDAVIDPAIALAENGFEIESRFAASLNSNFETFKKFESTKKIFTKGGINYYENEIFSQPELANTLKLIKIHGRDGFYTGITADLIEQEMLRGGGLITKQDLLNYQPIERSVVYTNYRGYDVYSMG
ncbi:MAG TPA: gamma-glutamyltransferase, partial [Ignavibacteria bacterium]